MGFDRFADIDDTKIDRFLWRKATTGTSAAGQWYDDSMLGGSPPANLYAATPLASAYPDPRFSMRHWRSDPSFTEHLAESMVFGGSGTAEAPTMFLLCDFLMYYPFVDLGVTDPQDLDNPVGLPRFEDGEGVKMFFVSQSSTSTFGVYTVSYTNQAGVSGRTASWTSQPASQSGEVMTGGPSNTTVGPFVGLQAGDTGVRSVERITFTQAPGGLGAIVLCKPIAQFSYLEIGTVAETSFRPRFPTIHGDAWLGLLRVSNVGVPSGRTYTGMLTTIRS